MEMEEIGGWYFRKSDFPSGSNNDYYVYLITPSGVISQPIQSVGSQNSTNSGRISFNSNGTRMSFINLIGLIELYDFDRCTGLISNPVTISLKVLWPRGLRIGVRSFRLREIDCMFQELQKMQLIHPDYFNTI